MTGTAPLRRKLFWAALIGALSALGPAAPAEAQTPSAAVRIGYLGQSRPAAPAASPLDEPAPDEGLAGARLGIADNNTTGRFIGLGFELVERRIGPDAEGEAVAAAAGEAVAASLAELA